MLWHHVAMTESAEPRGPITPVGHMQFELTWPDGATSGAPVVSNFAILGDGNDPPGGFYLLMGQVPPPPWFTEAERERGRAHINGRLTVEVRSAVYMTRQRVEELYVLLANTLGQRSGQAHD